MCICVCVYVCMYMCMYVCVYMYVCIYSRASKLFGRLNARRCDFNINIIIPTRKPPLSVSE